MKEARIRRELALLTLPFALMIAVAIYFEVTKPRLTGTWKVVNDPWSTSLVTFYPNGEYETVTTFSATPSGFYTDGSGVGRPCVWKGRFSESEKTFRFFDIKRYIRKKGVDVLFVPYADGNFNNVTQNEIIDTDKEMSKVKYFSTIVSSNWKAGILKVRSPDIGQYKGATQIWRRQS